MPATTTTKAPNKHDRIAKKRKARTEKKREAIRQEFNRLYNEKRLRYDDVIEELSGMFFVAPRTIEGYLKG
jgi:hypothetical protein